MTAHALVIGFVYVMVAAGSLYIVELSLIGTRLNRPVIVCMLALLFPVSLPILLLISGVRELLSLPRR